MNVYIKIILVWKDDRETLVLLLPRRPLAYNTAAYALITLLWIHQLPILP